MGSGKVKLFTKKDEQLQVRRYSCKNHRNEIIRIWERLYGKKFDTLYIIIAPSITLRDLEGEKRPYKQRARLRDRKTFIA